MRWWERLGAMKGSNMASMDDRQIQSPDMQNWTDWGIDDMPKVGPREIAYDYQPMLAGKPAHWEFTMRTSHKRAVEIRWLDADKRIVWPRALMDVEGDQWVHYVLQAIAPEGTCWMQGVILSADPDTRTGLAQSVLLRGDVAEPKQAEQPDWTINTEARHEPVIVMHGPGGETFRGGIVEVDGLTWWERKIRELEARANYGPELADARFRGRKGK